MKNISLYSLGFVTSAFLLAGCASRMHSQVKIEPVQTLVADTASMVDVDVNICIPKHTLSKRQRLIVVPQLVQHDSVWAEFRPVALDAPVYARKLNRRKKLYGYVDSLESGTTLINNREEYVLPYKERVYVPRDCQGGRIQAMLSADGCGECSQVDRVDMAYISSVPDLLEQPHKSLKLNWIEPVFVIRPKVMEGRGEALLQFTINLHNIDLNLGNNHQEMNTMLATLEKIVGDTLATLNEVKIYGMASADGSFAFNTRLAANRASSAKQWLVSQLGLKRDEAGRFQVGSRPEGWEPVLAAMRADGHPDTLQVQEILARYQSENDDAAERQIRKLKCWNDIKQRYLQKDRKVVYEYTYTLRSFTTDAELLEMYDKRPDAFNEEELLCVSTLKQTLEEKEEVYRTLLHYFPQSTVAANNLAVLLLRQGKVDEAERVLQSVKEFTPEVINTQAAVYVYRCDYEKAIELLQSQVQLPEARYNLGLLYAQRRELSEAFRLLRDYHDVNAAVVSLSVNETAHASSQMNLCEDVSARAAYVRAIIQARQADKEQMLLQLRQAVKEKEWHNRAAADVEFRSYWSDIDFKELVKGGNE